MDNAIYNADAHLVGLFIRTFLYGVYLVLVAHGLRWTFFEDEGWRLRPRINRLTLTLVVLVFVSTSGTLAIWFILTLSVIRLDILLPYRSDYILASVTLENVTALAIDAMLIFRCWVVSNNSWPMICFPLFLWLANIGLFVTTTYKTVINEFPVPMVEGFYSCNMVITIYATSAIIYQIMRVARKRSAAAGGSMSDLYKICRIMIECALPYLFSIIFQLTAMAIGTNLFFFPTNCALNSAMNAIAFNLLVIRVGLHRIDGKQNNSSSLRFNVATRDILEDHTSETSDKGTQEIV